MSDNELTKKDLQEIKGTKSVFDKETIPKIEKNIDELIVELDNELVENKIVIAENHKKIAEAVNYDHEQYLRLIQLI